MEQISRIGMDTSKRFFQLHGVNTAETVVFVDRDLIGFMQRWRR